MATGRVEADESPTRELRGLSRKIFDISAACFAGFYLYTALFGTISVETHLTVILGGSIILTLFLYPSLKKRREKEHRPQLLDISFMLLTAASMYYFIKIHPHYAFLRAGLPPSLSDMVLGIIALVTGFEACRRTMGLILPGIGIFFFLYTVFGPYFPGELKHSGFPLTTLVPSLYLTTNGIFGPVTGVAATYVFPFIIFGGFVIHSRCGQFFLDLVIILTQRARGGPAKAAVLGSAAMASINGSQVANVATTGSITIPMMKKAGFRPEVAGGIEAAASLGGAITPPVMGAGAFLIAEFTGIPYWDIVVVSFFPALLYYLYMFLEIHAESMKRGIEPQVDKGGVTDTLRTALELFKRQGFLLTPIFVIVYLLMKGFSPRYAAVGGVVSLVGVSALRKGTRMSLQDILNSFITATRVALIIGSLLVVIGTVVYCVIATGLGQKLAFVIMRYKVPLPGVIVIIILVSLFLGMGVTVAPSYIITAVVAAPMLDSFGVPMLAAHLLIFWYSQDATVTPPVCLSSYTAASIAGADRMKTGFQGWRFAKALYIIPFLFVYTPLLLNGPFWEVARTVVTCAIAMVPAVGCVEGLLLERVSIVGRVMLAVSAFALFASGLTMDLIGLGILLAFFSVQVVRRRKVRLASLPEG